MEIELAHKSIVWSIYAANGFKWTPEKIQSELPPTLKYLTNDQIKEILNWFEEYYWEEEEFLNKLRQHYHEQRKL